MEYIQDGAIAFFSAVGLATCVWMVAGAFLSGTCRNPRVRLTLPLWGDAPAMEADLHELLRARRTLPLATILLVDCGMTSEARQSAECFCERFQRVEVVEAGNVKIQ